MAFRVLVDPTALAEAEEAFLWRHEHAPLEALRWFHGLWRAIESLQEMPTRCPLAPEALVLRRPGDDELPPRLSRSARRGERVLARLDRPDEQNVRVRRAAR